MQCPSRTPSADQGTTNSHEMDRVISEHSRCFVGHRVQPRGLVSGSCDGGIGWDECIFALLFMKNQSIFALLFY